MTAWKATVASGVVLISVSLVASFANLLLDFDRFGYLFAAEVIGTVASIVGLVGWATKLGRRERLIMAFFVFIFPWIVLFIDHLVVPSDRALAVSQVGMGILLFPSWMLTFVFLIMATVARPRS
jgi:hypothetical protein